MRLGPGLVVAIAAALSGCTPPAASNQAAEAPAAAASDTPPVLAIGGGDPAACGGAWNGEAVTREALRDRSFAELQRFVAAAGGVEGLDELPHVRVEVPAATRWSCARPWLAVLEQSGYPRAQLVTLEPNESRPFANFQIPGMAPPRATVTVGRDGGLSWNGEKVDAAGLRARAARSDPFDEPPPSASGAPPPPVVGMSDDVLIEAGEDVPMAAIRDAILVLTEAQAQPLLATGDPATAGTE